MSLDTLARPATFAVEIRHSRFVAHAAAVDSPAQALREIAARSTDDAGHHCWAYRVGADYRTHDDGEPAGTAGRPILAAIDGQGCDRVVVVVARWFGGVKLGAGGLVRAYGGTAAECLRTAERVPLVALVDIDVHAAFDDLGHVHAAAAAFAAEKHAAAFDASGARLRLRVPADTLAALKSRLRDATRDRIRIDDGG